MIRQWVGNPFRPDLPLPKLSSALFRCARLQDQIALSNLEVQPIKPPSTGVSSSARVIASSPHSILNTSTHSVPTAFVPSDTSTNPGSTTTTTTLASPGESVESVCSCASQSPIRTTVEAPISVAPFPLQHHSLKHAEGYTELPGEFAEIPSFSINWTSFLESRRDNIVNETPIHRTSRPNGNPLLYMSAAYQGVQELWSMKTMDADQNFVAGVAGDPSGLLPVDVLSLQACCRIFEILVLESECFTIQLANTLTKSPKDTALVPYSSEDVPFLPESIDSFAKNSI